ncbi:Leucine Rich Repeat (LRR)-containing protein [Cylindrospermum stagnale PCC 7417]|uniref:non-specific serine/threonine protein kinase n=1 Tax=Cylindrospermum stagnale PCC 7417 TaxID=56107 RepID=K9WV03_9NOST|nr:leucine-rich repeat protein [Cylindrospermum stagnale]AFZ23596.1 Leucine Rich Repeat (LRR)-containing protein [Cylindrospermum stagnale PCC 7417]
MATTPQSVLAKIREAKEKRLIKLDLRNDWGTPDKDKLTEIPAEVFALTWLEELDLSRNEMTTLPDAIAKLQNLSTLYLSHNGITTLPDAIAQLQNLNSLDLSYNGITTLPDAIAKLHNLTTLNLSVNKITTLPDAIAKLHNLTTLNLSVNRIRTLPDAIAKLHNLTSLNLNGNRITTLPDAIAKLHNLTSLDLSGNRITTLPDAIAKLHNLTSLSLWNNGITTLPDAIAKLHNLTSLDLSGNRITTLPDAIAKLQNLSTLDLRGNEITTLPDAIAQLHNLTSLDLRRNPIEKPPLEVVKKGIEAIRDYFRQLEAEGTDYLYEAKLLIIGEGGAGKTTLAKKIENENYQLQDEDSTKGIEVIPWHFTADGRDFQVNLWDFGGQEIYHATHQFFLTKRSLYILVADTRKEDTDFHYWLNVVELLTDNSPLLIIKNEKQDRHREINEPQLRGRFNNLKETLATNFDTKRGLPELLKLIQHQITSLPHIGIPLPKTWVKVREALENDSRNYIRLAEYLQICQTNGFTLLKNKLQLSSYLHDLGVCLHFQDDPILNNIVILKPKWGTEAVYRVLDDKQVINNSGKFTWKDLQNIWHEEQYATKRGELLQLMINFKLCYEIPHSPKTYIAPQLLTEKQPKYHWNESENLILRYTYDFMPKGIVTQFIVAIHEFIDEQKYVWKSGVILSKDATKAEIIEFYDQREIKIRVAGSHKKDLLTIVTYELDKIHNAYKKLKYNKLIPCNCDTCKGSQKPHFYKFESLKKRISDKRSQVECDVSYQMVNVLDLIDDVIDRGRDNLFTEREDFKINQMPNISVNVTQVQEQKNQIHQKRNNNMSTYNQYGSGDNVAGDKVMGDKIGTQINNSQNLAQAAKDIKELLDQLSQKYSNNGIVGARAIEEIESKPTLKARVVNAIKEAGTEAFEKAVDHPAVSIVIAATKGFIDG